MRQNGALGYNHFKNSEMHSNNNLSVCASILIDNDEPRHLLSKRGSIHQQIINAAHNKKSSLNSAMKHSVMMLR
jgi:hypothetical protein